MHDDGTLSTRGATTATGKSTVSHRVLIVDDDVVLCLLNSERLLRCGYQVDTAEDGDAGWEALQSKHYDLLVTDQNMPKVSGVELIKKLRAAALDLPVILVSGALPMEELDRCPWLQLAAMLSKPFTGDELLRTVEKVLGEAGITRAQIKSPPLRRSHSSVHGLSV